MKCIILNPLTFRDVFRNNTYSFVNYYFIPVRLNVMGSRVVEWLFTSNLQVFLCEVTPNT